MNLADTVATNDPPAYSLLHPERSGNPDPATEETTVPLAVAYMCGFDPKPLEPRAPVLRGITTAA
jgi:hypothetical protein